MKRRFKTVEWLDERCIGHGEAYRQNGRVYVEVRITGSVLLNGKEYIIDQVVTVPAERCTISPED